MESSENLIYIKSLNYENMMDLGKILSKFILHSKVHLIYLKGDLGSGKTSLVRSILHGLGICETISSPSFSIIEIYDGCEKNIIHIDLFRIHSPYAWRTEEIRNCIENDKNLTLLEWPEKARLLPNPSLLIELLWSNESDPHGPRDIKISGIEISKLYRFINTQCLKNFTYE